MSDKSQHFESSAISDFYLKYRPTYGPDVFDTIIAFCKETQTASVDDNLSLAVDLGCGSGQSTLPLCKHFRKVIGVDVSESQIANAPTHVANLSFRTGPSEDLSFIEEDNSIDLVTVAQAMHWMDTQRLYPEVERVLKPGGAFVVYGYGIPALDDAKAQEVLDHFYTELGPYWPDGRNRVEEHYKSYSLPFAGWRRNDTLKIERNWTVDDFVGYLCSWSAFHKYLMANPLNDTMGAIRLKLQEIYQNGPVYEWTDKQVKITWPIFMLMGHKPQV